MKVNLPGFPISKFCKPVSAGSLDRPSGLSITPRSSQVPSNENEVVARPPSRRKWSSLTLVNMRTAAATGTAFVRSRSYDSGADSLRGRLDPFFLLQNSERNTGSNLTGLRNQNGGLDFVIYVSPASPLFSSLFQEALRNVTVNVADSHAGQLPNALGHDRNRAVVIEEIPANAASQENSTAITTSPASNVEQVGSGANPAEAARSAVIQSQRRSLINRVSVGSILGGSLVGLFFAVTSGISLPALITVVACSVISGLVSHLSYRVYPEFQRA